MSAPQVRPFTPQDVALLLDLIDALADFESLPRPDEGARARLAADALGDPPPFRVLLVEIGGQAAGYALYFLTYSTFLGRPVLYLEDLFVRPAARGRGAGLALFRACAAEAVRLGCARMDWQVLDWNAPAIAFYSRLGGRRLAAWLPFRLEGAALQQVAEGAL